MPALTHSEKELHGSVAGQPHVLYRLRSNIRVLICRLCAADQSVAESTTLVCCFPPLLSANLIRRMT